MDQTQSVYIQKNADEVEGGWAITKFDKWRGIYYLTKKNEIGMNTFMRVTPDDILDVVHNRVLRYVTKQRIREAEAFGVQVVNMHSTLKELDGMECTVTSHFKLVQRRDNRLITLYTIEEVVPITTVFATL